MNVFFLDSSPEVAARYHCDKHVVKMCVEYAQLLSTAVHIVDPGLGKIINVYKRTHENHPCAIWARHSSCTFGYVRDLALALGKEFTTRYGGVHKSIATVVSTMRMPEFTCHDWIDPPQCMPDQYKCNDTVQAYRNYYLGDKVRFATWKTTRPSWWTV